MSESSREILVPDEHKNQSQLGKQQLQSIQQLAERVDVIGADVSARNVKSSSKKRGSVLYKPGATKSRAAIVSRDLSRSKLSSRTSFPNSTLKSLQKKQLHDQLVDFGVVGSRTGSGLSSPISAAVSRVPSPSEFIVAVQQVNQKPSVDIRKSRLVKSADPKLIIVGPPAPTEKVLAGKGETNEMAVVKSLAVPRAHLSTIVQAKIVATKWRSFHAQKKVDAQPSEANQRLTLNSAPLPRQRCSDVITPTINGMRIFGISKGGITRAIVKFSEPPPSWPLTVCFHFPSTFLTHRYVLDMVRSKIAKIPDARVTTIQFIDRNTMHGTQGLDNRWLVTLNCSEARDALLQKGLHLFNRHIILRHYNDILLAEYKEYLEYLSLQKRMYAKMREMMAENGNSDRPITPTELSRAGDATKLLFLSGKDP